jgi:hypothetical protein
MNNWEFVESMQRALDLVKQIIEDLGKAKPLPPPPPAPEPAPAPAPAPRAPAPAPVLIINEKTQTKAVVRNPENQKSNMSAADFSSSLAKAQAKAANPARTAAAILAASRPASSAYLFRAGGGMIIPKRMAMGGKAKGYPMGGLIPYKADGGFFKSLGSDTIPAMLTPGEFVVRRPAVRGFGVDNLEKINNGTYSDGSVYTYNLAVNVKSNSDPDKIARTVMKHIDRVESQKIRGNKL